TETLAGSSSAAVSGDSPRPKRSGICQSKDLINREGLPNKKCVLTLAHLPPSPTPCESRSLIETYGRYRSFCEVGRVAAAPDLVMRGNVGRIDAERRAGGATETW